MKPWAVWRLDGPNGRQIERIAEADTREKLETKYKRRLDSYYGIYHKSPARKTLRVAFGSPLPADPVESVYTSALMAMWEITITCRDGSRLRLSERRDHAPLKGDIFDTADTGQIIKARIDTHREEQPSGSRPPFFQSRRPNCKVGHNDACFIVKDRNGIRDPRMCLHCA